MRIGWRGVAAIVALHASAQAATITVSPPNSSGIAFIEVVGDFENGDEEAFRIKTSGLTKAVVLFASDGGSLTAGIQIGKDIRLKGFVSVVPEGLRCASACAIAWLGGSRQFMGKGASIGFHSAYQRDTGEVSGPANARLGAYLDEIGLPDKAIYYITEARPEGMTWLTLSDAESVGIDVKLFETKKEPPSSNGASPLSADELTIAGQLARNVELRLTAGIASLGQSIIECYKQATLTRKEESALYCISLDILGAELWSGKATIDQTAYAGIRQRAQESFSTLGKSYRAVQLLERAALIADRARALLAEAQTAEEAKETMPRPSVAPFPARPAPALAPVPASTPPPAAPPLAPVLGSTPSAPASAPTPPPTAPVSAATSLAPAVTPPAPATVSTPNASIPAPTPANTPPVPVPPSPPAAVSAPIAAPAPTPPPAATVSTSPAAPPPPAPPFQAPTPPPPPAASVPPAAAPTVPAPSVSVAPPAVRCGLGTHESNGQCLPIACRAGERLNSAGACARVTATQRVVRPTRPHKPHDGGCIHINGASFC